MSEIGTCVRVIDKNTGYSFLTGEIVQCKISKKIILHTGKTVSMYAERLITISTSGHFIDEYVCNELVKFGVEQIWVSNSYINVSPKYYDMIVFKMDGAYILREDTDVKRLIPNSRICVDREQSGYMCDKIYELIINDVSNGRRLVINNDKTLVDLLRCDTIKWVENNYSSYARVNTELGMGLPVLVSPNSSVQLTQAWWRRIKQDNIRKRDIPGFERELID